MGNLGELATAGVAAAIAALCFLGFGLQGCGVTVEVYSPRRVVEVREAKRKTITNDDREQLSKLIERVAQ